LSVEIPVWILFYATSDKEIVDLIDYGEGDGRIHNILFASIREADKCDTFRRGKNAVLFLEERVKGVQYPPSESIDECLNLYVFPNIKGLKRKARYLAYMVKVLLLAYTGRQKTDNRDDFQNKRLELTGELREHEIKVHFAHARKRMGKALQRDLYGD
jgi:DNA-directed RNA polymerase IV and V subunit 2